VISLVLAAVGVGSWIEADAAEGSHIPRPALQLPQSLPVRYGVLGVRIEAAADTAVKVISTTADSPAARAGLRSRDLILAAAQYRISSPRDLSRYIQSLEPGTEVSLLVERATETDGRAAGTRLELGCMVTDVKRLYPLMNERAAGTPTSRFPRHHQLLAGIDSLERTAARFVDTMGHKQTLLGLQRAFAFEGERYGADLRLGDVQLALTHPLKGAAMADGLSQEIAGFGELRDYLRLASDRLDLAPLNSGGPAADRDEAADRAMAAILSDAQWPPTLVDELLVPFASANRRVEDAFRDLAEGERQQLLRQIPPLLIEFATARALDQGDDSQIAQYANTLRLAKKVDVAQLLAAAAALAQLTEAKTLKRIRKASRSLPGVSEVAQLPPTFGGTFLYAHRSDLGWVVIGGDGDNIYGEDAAIIIDLGGDDIYLNNCGAPVFVAVAGQATHTQRSAVGLLLDFDGDDEYVGNGWGSLGSAIGGVGFLIDLKGDDTYSGDSLTQGAAFCGVGVLWDQKGNDRYHAQRPAQAAAFFGAGLLLDRAGSDHYAAAEQAQGFGGAGGFGLLYDRQGDDRYLADRGAPSSYGAAGGFEGWSQGVGCGFRRSAPGGIGVLVDGAGDDFYQAGNFSQGTGYFFGMGMLVDRAGDDRYRSTRYSQGAAAHQAVGCLLDVNGDDDYFARQAANQGAAWDAAVGILEDRAGDDRYVGGGLAQGAASMNGVGILFDWAGEDYYAVTDGQGRAGSVEYWGGRDALNIGMLLDTGGQSDRYSEDGRGDNTKQASAKGGLFLDR